MLATAQAHEVTCLRVTHVSDTHEPSAPDLSLCARAFTLIELLVVVAIAALLVAILLPSLTKARDQAKYVTCQTRLREISNAWQAYFHDSRDRLPERAVNLDVNYGGQQGTGGREFGSDPRFPVPKRLNSYLGLKPVAKSGADVFACPTDRGGESIQPSAFVSRGSSYRANSFLIGQLRVGASRTDPCYDVLASASSRLGEVKTVKQSPQPSLLVLLGEFEWYKYCDRSLGFGREWHGKQGLFNLSFLDGRVGLVRVRKGILVSKDYVMLPFTDLIGKAAGSQQEVQR